MSSWMKTDHSILEDAEKFEGKDKWHLNTEEGVTLSDGPNGLRIEDELGLGFNHSKEATAFPTAALVGCSFDRDLLREYGEKLAEECVQAKVDVLLGPGVNTKRSPLCGRNFEYFSEDPVLSGEYAASYINGVQSKGVGTSLKHFAANSCELGRQVQDSIMDERTLHEIYLRQFEITVRKSHPWTMMPAYNQLNGVYCCENKQLFDLARSWGFDGIFISDWGGVSNPIHSIQSGLNVEMPGRSGSARFLAKAVAEGVLSPECIKRSSQAVTAFSHRCGQYEVKKYDQKDHDAFCQKAAEESIVLLKNQNVLPLKRTDQIAVIGPYALKPCIQGAGSSRVNDAHSDWFLKRLDQSGITYSYAPGYSLENEEIDEKLHEEAMDCVKGKDKVIFFAGESSKNSGEGFDRTSMDLPFNQNTLIRDLVHENCHVIVVLQTGSPVILPWRNMVDGIVCEYEAGKASGIALQRILYGEVNPSGHLAETWPVRQEDNPSARYYDAHVTQSQYREGIYVGYRYYDTFKISVAYPFGYGLSYTEFQYTNLKITGHESCIHGSFKVKNSGTCDGRTAAQIYIGMKNSRIARPCKELKEFASVFLKAGEEKEMSFEIPYSLLTYYDVRQHSWQNEKGIYEVMIGTSVNDIVLQKEMELDGVEDPYSSLRMSDIQYDEGMVYVSDDAFRRMLERPIPAIREPKPVTPDTTIRELQASRLGSAVNFVISRMLRTKALHNVDDASVYNAPLRQLLWLKDHYTWQTVYAAAAYMNHHGWKEWKSLISSVRKKKSVS